jgi:hypothetical protein
MEANANGEMRLIANLYSSPRPISHSQFDIQTSIQAAGFSNGHSSAAQGPGAPPTPQSRPEVESATEEGILRA